MRYYAHYDENGRLINIGVVSAAGVVHGEITENEYLTLLSEISAAVKME